MNYQYDTIFLFFLTNTNSQGGDAIDFARMFYKQAAVGFVSIVEKVENGFVYTVEDNSSSNCCGTL